MEVLIRDSEIILDNLNDSEVRTQINGDSILTKLIIRDSDINVVYAASSQIEGDGRG